MSAVPDKIYLNVPFPEKDRAKGLGARWDPAARKWYVGGRTQLAAFREWLPPDLDLNDSEAVEALASEATTTERGVALSAFLAKVSEAIAVHVPKSQWVKAEISQLRAIKGGHLTIELVEHDAEGQLTARVQAFVWNGRAAFIQEKFEQATGAHLAAGLKVMFQLSAEFRPTYGLRTIVEDVDPAYTLGDIEAKLKAIRDTLTMEGVIALNSGLPAPVEFCHVAVVSPLEAAGLGDFRRDADRLHEAGICRFDYYTAKFQGQDAPASLLEALARVLADYEAGQRFDAVCIIRGGGSVTDLYWLNDLALARAVCRLPVPVFTGIGHERDNTILDEVAHRRCDTPSKVIGWISGTVYANANAAIENLLSLLKTAGDAIAINERTIELLRREVESLGNRMLTTNGHEMARWVDEIRHRTLSRLQTAEHDLSRHVHEIRLLSLSRISSAEQDLDHQRAVIAQLGGQRIAEAAQAIEAYAREILGQGPKATLRRGFALAHGQDGKPVPSPAGGVRLETFIPWTLVKRSIRRGVMPPIGAPAEFRKEAQQAKSRQEQHSPLLRDLGLAHYWQQLLDDGKFRSLTEIAAAEGMDVGRVSRVLRLAQLSPAITSAILAGTSGRITFGTAIRCISRLEWNLERPADLGSCQWRLPAVVGISNVR